MFSSFSNIFSESTRSETSFNSDKSLHKTGRRFFKRKRKCDVDRNLIKNTIDSTSDSRSERSETSKQRASCQDGKIFLDDKIKSHNDRFDETERTDKTEIDQSNEEKWIDDVEQKKIDKLSNKLKDRSSKGLNKFSRWLYNKFEHHHSNTSRCDDKDELLNCDLVDKSSNTKNSDVNSDENVNSKFLNKMNEQYKDDSINKKPFDIDQSTRSNRFFDSRKHFLFKKPFNDHTDHSANRIDENDGDDDESTSDSSIEDDCNCCKQKIKKMRLERLKLKKQLKQRSYLRKCFVFLNPIILLAVFFYLLYCELTAVRAEVINLTTTISNLNSFDNLVNGSNNLTKSITDQKRIDKTTDNLMNLDRKLIDQSNDKSEFKSEKHKRMELNRNVNRLNNQNSDDNRNIDENDDRNDDDKSDDLDSKIKEIPDFYLSTLKDPLRIPISKRNFFDNFNIRSKQSNRQYAQSLNLPAFKILAILPTTLSPQLSRHLHRSMELYYAYSEGLVSALELAQYFEHLRQPNFGMQTDLSSSLHHLQFNTTINERHHSDRFLFHTNHSELSFEDHLYTHLIQRIHHRNRTQHHSESNTIFSATPDKPIIFNDQLFAQNPHLNDKQYIDHFIQTNRKRLRPIQNINQQTYESQSTQFVEYNQQPEMQLSLLPLGNSSQRLINSLCDSIEIQRPTMILSLVEPTRNYYLEMLARISDIPMLTLTGEYEETASLQKLLIEVNFNPKFHHLIKSDLFSLASL